MSDRAGNGRGIPYRFVHGGLFAKEVRTLENRPDRFVEFATYLGRVWHIEWDGAWSLTGERRTLALEELLRFAQAELYGPDLAAGTSEFSLDD